MSPAATARTAARSSYAAMTRVAARSSCDASGAGRTAPAAGTGAPGGRPAHGAARPGGARPHRATSADDGHAVTGGPGDCPAIPGAPRPSRAGTGACRSAAVAPRTLPTDGREAGADARRTRAAGPAGATRTTRGLRPASLNTTFREEAA
ncbi:hypothetical protein [Streptomyces sp. NPDC003943]